MNIRQTRWRHHIKMVVDAVTSEPRNTVLSVVLLALFGTAIGLALYAGPGEQTRLMVTTSGADSEEIVSVSLDVTDAVLPDERDGGDIDILIDEVVPVEDGMIRYFDGRPIRPVRILTMEVTGYSPDARSCAPFDDGITASGYSVWTNGMKLLAADKRYSFGSLMSVPGYNGNRPVPVLDRGAAIKGNRLDVLFPTHREARIWGRRKLTVTVWDYVE